ncbi:MAG: DUF4363 family protein [Clostridia bacterium]|nr:DUF4363 family protein [Clostridium sp.]MBS6252366.1 DUF4363 family protein [Clostridium sp.]
MFKEIFICILILSMIFVGNYITQSYTLKSVNEISSNLVEIKDEMQKENIESKKVNDKIGEMSNNLERRHDKLSYYIEHNEIEKLETELTSLKSYVEVEQYDEAINEIDRALFLLNHIKDKYEFNMKTVL